MKYIFLAGAPGSRWSSVAKFLYTSPQIDTTDNVKSYTRPGETTPMHLGAYWDPGMEHGQQFHKFDQLTIEECESEFKLPFGDTSNLTRVIKSHQFGKFLYTIKNNWPFCPIVIAMRDDQVCYDWWQEAGGFDITYPNYSWYSERMLDEILTQNRLSQEFIQNEQCVLVKNTTELASILGIEIPQYHDFAAADTKVYVYIPSLVNYFGKSWNSNIKKYKYSGLALLEKINQHDSILDVGCGDNFFKQYYTNLVGIDPSNPKADYQLALEEYVTSDLYDSVLCLGSLNFGSEQTVKAQVQQVVNLTRPGGTIYWRCNPGLHDHPWPGQEHIDFFPWSIDLHKLWSEEFGCQLKFCDWDTDNRIYAEWVKL